MKRQISKENIELLNKKHVDLTPSERIQELYVDFKSNEIMLTSSFAATSAYLLYLFSQYCPKQIVYFIDTGCTKLTLK